MRKIQVIGVIASEAVATTVKNRIAINFKVVENESYKDSAGNVTNKTHWFSCTYWRDDTQNNNILSLLRIGNKIYVEGVPSLYIFTNQNGESIPAQQIEVKQLEIIK